MIGVMIITLMSLVLGLILVSVSKEEEDEILKHLPGLNCGACGFGSCKGMSDAIRKDASNYLKCLPLRGEKKEAMEKFLKTLEK